MSVFIGSGIGLGELFPDVEDLSDLVEGELGGTWSGQSRCGIEV